jgi:hypothetical protein
MSLFTCIETNAQARHHGWQIHMRWLVDGMRGLKHKRERGYRVALDMGPLHARLGLPARAHRRPLRCPATGCRRVAVRFGPPDNVGVMAARR